MRSTPLALASENPVFSDPDDPAVTELRDRLLGVLDGAGAGTTVPVSFSGKALSGSCLAVVLSEALQRITKGRYPDRYVVVHDPKGGNAWDADAALRKVSTDTKSKLVCVWDTGASRPTLVGDVDRIVQKTYDFILDSENAGGPSTTRELAEATKMRIQAASNRVSKAIALGIVRTVEEQPAEGGGVQRVLLAVR